MSSFDTDAFSKLMRRIFLTLTLGAARRAMSISTRASSNLHPSKLGEVRSYCFRNQYDPTNNADGIIALAIAENKLMRDEIATHINKNFNITPWHLTYGDGAHGSTPLKTAISDFMNVHFKPLQPITKEQIVVCNGAGTAVNNLCFCIGEPGDGVLLGRPYYTGFVPDIEAYAKFKLLAVPFGDIDPLSPEAVSCYEAIIHAAEASGVRVRALLVANPHNPLGRPYPPATLLGLMQLCTRHGIHLISDEVYCLSYFSSADVPTPPPFVSVLSLDLAAHNIDPSLVHVIYGLSKDFCANGIRIGSTVVPSNPQLMRALKSIASFSRPSQLAEHVWLNLLNDTAFQAVYFPELQRRLGGAYGYVTDILRREGVGYRVASVGSFLWVDLRRYLPRRQSQSAGIGGEGRRGGGELTEEERMSMKEGEEAELALNWRMARDAKVWLGAGRSFDAEEYGWFRLTFATPREELEMGMGRLLGLLRRVEVENKREGG